MGKVVVGVLFLGFKLGRVGFGFLGFGLFWELGKFFWNEMAYRFIEFFGREEVLE